MTQPLLKRGTNFSHWLSQTDLSKTEHLETAISVEDFQRMADYGADHIRQPVDFPLIESPEAGGGLRPEGMSYVDRAVKWARQAGLAIIIDLHSAPGMCFATPDDNDIWTNTAKQERFAGLWRRLAQHYQGPQFDHVAFELVNEPTAADNADWNRIARIGLEAVRSVDATRTVLIGSNSWSNPVTFSDLEDFGDPNVVYNFHLYEPFIFTHQRAPWVEHLKCLDMAIDYPTVVPDLSEAAAAMPTEAMREQTLCYSGVRLDASRLADTLAPVLAFRQKCGRPVYCGEFGVYGVAPVESQLRWYEDVMVLFDRCDIGWANWDYKGGFGLLTAERRERPIRPILFP